MGCVVHNYQKAVRRMNKKSIADCSDIVQIRETLPLNHIFMQANLTKKLIGEKEYKRVIFGIPQSLCSWVLHRSTHTNHRAKVVEKIWGEAKTRRSPSGSFEISCGIFSSSFTHDLFVQTGRKNTRRPLPELPR